MNAKKRWIDITIPIRDSMVCWPDDPHTVVKRYKDVDKGDPVTMSQITMISHIGTHIDAPLHFIPHGKTIDKMPLETAIGPALVIEIENPEAVKLAEIKNYRIRKGDRVLFKTMNSSRVYRNNDFISDYVYITPEVARFLADRQVSMVGLDYISVGSIKQPSTLMETHKALLSQGIWIIEGLNLQGVEPGRYEMICLPIKLENGDAGIVRAVLRPK